MVFGMDGSVNEFFVDNRPEWLGHLAEVVTVLGRFPVHIVLILAVGFAIRRQSQAIAIATVAAVFAYGLNTVLKNLIDRARPPEAGWFDGYNANGYSMPSGHSINAAVLGVTLYMWLPGRWRLVGPLVTLAVMWSRLELGVHWPSDVIVGAIIGAVIAIAFHKLAPKLLEVRQ